MSESGELKKGQASARPPIRLKEESDKKTVSVLVVMALEIVCVTPVPLRL
jgi:hypothetical protein